MLSVAVQLLTVHLGSGYARFAAGKARQAVVSCSWFSCGGLRLLGGSVSSVAVLCLA